MKINILKILIICLIIPLAGCTGMREAHEMANLAIALGMKVILNNQPGIGITVVDKIV